MQAIGSRLTGITKTPPIHEIIRYVGSEGGAVLDAAGAHIDQVEGVKRASDMSFKHIAATIAGFQAKAITKIRRIEKDSCLDVAVFSVCNTCVASADVKHINKAGLACASASRLLRTRIGRKPQSSLARRSSLRIV